MGLERTRVVFLTMLASFAACGWVAAGEGMWLPEQLPAIADELRAAGLAADPAKLADLTGDPMGAIVWLGGCSASFVSPQGLVATNHHCAYGSIQYNSTAERNLLDTGFLAASLADELPASPGSRMYVTLAAEDVTATINAAIPEGADGAARYAAIEKAEKELVAACEATPGRRCRVSSFHGGLFYRLYTQLEIRDVRLVYAPAGGVGKYGGDVDNWMWPRHTGDFSFLRAYVGPDGSPAEPSPDNVPYRPAHWLKIGTDGVEAGDYVMVVGFPGSTGRYRTADEVEDAIDWSYPRRIERLRDTLEIIERETAGRPRAAIAYAGMVSGLNNGLKNSEGMVAGFAKSGSVARKRALEAELEAWIAAEPERQARWGSALSELRALLAEEREHRERDAEVGSIARSQLMSTASTLYRLARERELPDAERTPGYQDRDLARTRGRLARMERSFDAQVDRALLGRAFERYTALPAAERLPAVDRWFGLSDPVDHAALGAKLDAMYAATTLTDTATRMALLEADRATLEASEEPFMQLAVATYDTWRQREAEDDARSGRMQAVRPRFMAALVAFHESRGEVVYPDANGTLRVTFGEVAGYTPRDAVDYRPFTTAAGIAEKATGEDPFDAPQPLLDAIAAGDWGPYAADALGTLPVNFLSTVDTTGGNSGSATLDAHGRLVGLLFDGNWESLISDWDFLPDVTRSIQVDIRYLLWVMDRVDGAWRLLEEMGVEPAFRPAGEEG